MNASDLRAAYEARKHEICLCPESRCECDLMSLWSMPDDVIAGRLLTLHSPEWLLEALERIAFRGTWCGDLTPDLAARLVRLVSDATEVAA